MNIDAEFARSNYWYVLSHLENESVQKIYKILGPLDFFIKQDNELKESLENENRQM